MSVCLSVCHSACVPVCLFVCLSLSYTHTHANYCKISVMLKGLFTQFDVFIQLNVITFTKLLIFLPIFKRGFKPLGIGRNSYLIKVCKRPQITSVLFSKHHICPKNSTDCKDGYLHASSVWICLINGFFPISEYGTGRCLRKTTCLISPLLTLFKRKEEAL